MLYRAFARWAVHGDFHAAGLCSEDSSRRGTCEICTEPGICRASTAAGSQSEYHGACKNGGQPPHAADGCPRKPNLVVPPLWLFLTIALAFTRATPGASRLRILLARPIHELVTWPAANLCADGEGIE